MKGEIDMDMMEMAAQLGKIIKESETYRELEIAKEAYEKNEQIKQYMQEYQVDRQALENAAAQENPETLVIETLQNRLDELYKLITEDPSFIRLTDAQNAVNVLMEQVNNEITFAITGQRPCTHDCSTCHGCH